MLELIKYIYRGLDESWETDCMMLSMDYINQVLAEENHLDMSRVNVCWPVENKLVVPLSRIQVLSICSEKMLDAVKYMYMDLCSTDPLKKMVAQSQLYNSLQQPIPHPKPNTKPKVKRVG